MYAHLKAVSPELKTITEDPNFTLAQSQLIGYLGRTGSGFCHLHFDLLNFDPSVNAPGRRNGCLLSTAGYDPYPDKHPGISCLSSTKHCLDPKNYFRKHLIETPITVTNEVEIFGRPDGNTVIARASSGQLYPSLSIVDGWAYIMIPHPFHNASTAAGTATDVFGWFEPAPFSVVPPPGERMVTVEGRAIRNGLFISEVGAPVLSAPGGTELTKVWGGHAYWSDDIRSAGNGCATWWWRIFVPPSRAQEFSSGWVCGEFLDVGPLACFASSAEGLALLPKEECPGPDPTPPAVSTNPASSATESSATLNLSVNPNSSSTDVWFQWGTSSSLGTSTESQNVGSGSSELDLGITLTGLDCDEDYFFRAAAQNAAGTVFGSTRSFTTANCSSEGGETETRELLFNGDFEQGETFWNSDGDFHIGAASRPRSGSFYAFLSTAQWDAGNNLDGEILNVVTDVPANAESVEFSFWYSITTDETTSSTAFDKLHVDIIDFGNSTERKLTLSNLNSTEGTYNFRSFDISHLAGRSIGVNFIGTTDFSLPTVFRIDDVSVETVVPEAGIPPFVVTQEADQISSFSARLNLSVDPNELQTDIWFEWGEGSSLNFSTDQIAVGGGSTIFDVSDSLFGLDCETTYSFRALAQNSQGIDEGLPRTFTTGACPGGPPFADTDPADSITADSARLTAEVNPNDAPTETWFEWGTTTSLSNTTSPQSIPADNQYRAVTQGISSLNCDTTYYFQAVAQNTHGTDRGAIHSFSTADCGGGDGPGPGGHLAWAERQSCHGNSPALLLKWSPVEGAASVYTIERLDGGYNTAVNTSEDGFAHLVTQNLDYDQRYEFRVLAETGSGLTASNIVETFVIDRACVVAGAPASPPGPFIAWLEPTFCNDGSLAVEINWSESAGADSYTLERLAATGGVKRTVTDLQGPAFLDSLDLAPGILHAYILTAVNETGTTRAQLVPQILPEPGLCGETGLPGEFVLTAGSPFCSNDEPTIPISWTASAGADDFYRLRVFGEQGQTAGAGINTDSLGFSYDLMVGLSPGGVHQLYMIAESNQDSTKKRFSNSVFVYLPVDTCLQSAQAPDVNSKSPITVSGDGATLQASVRPNSSRTQIWFEWGTTAAYGQQTPTLDVGDGAFYLWPSTDLIDLACETEYHHRAVAQNAVGTTLGTDVSFMTGPCPSCGPPELLISNLTVASPEAYEACQSISVGPSVSVEATGDLRLIAPRVVFGDGFSVRSGGRLGVFTAQPALQEDFEDGDLADWEFQIFGSNQHTASWGLVQDGSTVLELVGGTTSGGGDVIAHRTDFFGEDYSISARLKVHEVRNGGHHSGLAVRVTNGLNFYELSVNRAQDLMRLLGWENGQERDIASASLPPSLLDDWVTIEFEVIGNLLRGHINGTLYIEATDGVHLGGNVGVVNSGSVTRFDDLVIAN